MRNASGCRLAYVLAGGLCGMPHRRQELRLLPFVPGHVVCRALQAHRTLGSTWDNDRWLNFLSQEGV